MVCVCRFTRRTKSPKNNFKIKKNPLNTNQLAKELELDYKAIQHHIRILEKNNLITKAGEKYGIVYFVSTFLEVNMETFEEIERKLDKSK